MSAFELIAAEFVPPAWRDLGMLNIYNPSLLQSSDGYIVAFRGIDGAGGRRIALARLDRDLQRSAAASQPFSEQVRFAPGLILSPHSRSWFADPRLFRLGERVYVSWNDGMPVDHLNSQFLVEIDEWSLKPSGFARRLRHRDGQLRHEKNWMLFSDGEAWKAIYSISPHRVLKLDAESDCDITFKECWTTPHQSKDYERSFGQLRGGAQPVICGDVYYHFCHSCRDEPDGRRRYVAAAYTFSKRPPFRVVSTARLPLPLTDSGFTAPRPGLNPHASYVVYPSGAVPVRDGWLVSYGLQDTNAVLLQVSESDVGAALSAAPHPSAYDEALFAMNRLVRRSVRKLVSGAGRA
jgi:predicted GH43/DUF377 family glycosyl hydrolase